MKYSFVPFVKKNIVVQIREIRWKGREIRNKIVNAIQRDKEEKNEL